MANQPALNASPILRIHGFAQRWYADGNASRLPPQPEIDSDLQDADLLVMAVRNCFNPCMVNLDDDVSANNGANAEEKNRLRLPTNQNHKELWIYLNERQGSGQSDNALARQYDSERGPGLLQILRNAKRDRTISDWR